MEHVAELLYEYTVIVEFIWISTWVLKYNDHKVHWLKLYILQRYIVSNYMLQEIPIALFSPNNKKYVKSLYLKLNLMLGLALNPLLCF